MVLRIALALALLGSAAGCNTIAGVGEDISSGARAVQRAL